MSVSFEVNVRDGATPEVARRIAAMSPQRLAAAVGPAVANLVREHFVGLPPNAKGWPTTHFWGRAQRATSWQRAADGVVVSVSQIGVRQRFYGGPIRPVEAKMLAIPARQEAYGKRPAEFDDLIFAMFKTPNGMVFALVQADRTEFKRGRPRKDGTRKLTTAEVGGGVMFWLVRSVDQDADPEVLPSNEEILETAQAAILEGAK